MPRQSSRPNMFYDAVNDRWILTGKAGVELASFYDNGKVVVNSLIGTGSGTLGVGNVGTLDTTRLRVGGSGQHLAAAFLFTGTSAAIAAIGSYQVEVGSIPVTGVRLKDTVICTPQAAMPGEVAVGQFFVSGSNNVNFYAANTDIAAVASFPVMPWTVLVVR